MLQVVLDPVVILRGLLNRYSPCGKLLRDYSDQYSAVFSDQTVAALRFLLLHPLLAVVFPRLQDIRRQRLDDLFLAARRVPLPGVPNQNVFAATALAAQADYVIVQDAVILAACAAHNIPTLDAVAFMALLDSQSAPQSAAPSAVIPNPDHPVQASPE